MVTYLLAALVVFVFTTILTIAGVGAAFIIVPTFYWLGIPLQESMAVALLLNALSMTFASVNNIRNRLVDFATAVPIIVAATLVSPLGAYTSQYVARDVLLWLFAGFLVFAGSMMLFYRPKVRQSRISSAAGRIILGVVVGLLAGFLGGLLGVGGGNLIVPVLIWLGFDPKRASGTTAFIVVFSSLSGFFGHTAQGSLNLNLLAFAAVASVAGALLGSWLMQARLKSGQVKLIVGLVLYVVAAKMLIDLIL
jgi:uncharacterized membrane protein YfcA